MVEKKLSVNCENILPIIKRWLYSEKDIFLRELISNSCDAISKLKIIESTKGGPYRIDITSDQDHKTLIVEDNGIGMTKGEVEKYISQIAFSGAEEFLKKYEQKDQMIGHFGLGFYSAYMVANKVEIDTLSYKKNVSAILWTSDGSSSYTISKGKREKRGTKITLHVTQENMEFLENNKIEEILYKYCPYLPFPIYLNGTLINKKEPLWLKNPSQCSSSEYLTFYRELYPLAADPVFWIHLNINYPFTLNGILYFPTIDRSFDIHKSSIKLFCNRVFVSDNCQDLLFDFLTILKGAIDSPDLPLNVSRSHLQVNKTVHLLASHISKKVTDRLSSLYLTDRDKFISSWKDIEPIIKLGILQNDKFYEKAKNFLIWKTTQNEWLTIEEYLQKTKENNKIFYTDQDNHWPCLDLYHKNNIEVIISSNPYLDPAIFSYLESKTSVKFHRVDSDIDPSILDPSKEKTILNSQGQSQAAEIANFIRSSLNIKDLEIEPKSLANSNLPGFIMLKEEQRRVRDYMKLTNNKTKFSTKPSFVINTNSKLISQAHALSLKHPHLAKEIVKQIYDLTLLSQKELPPEEISNFIKRSNHLLEKLITLN